MITIKQMVTLERDAHKRGIFVKDIIRNVGKNFVEIINENFDISQKHIIIFSGNGNNGGDGFSAAKFFAKNNPVVVFFFGEKEKLTEEALDIYEKIKTQINIIKIAKKEDLNKFHFQGGHELLLIDCLLGTGTKGAIKEPINWAIKHFNSLGGIKVSMDIPSGYNADTGKKLGPVCDVDLIVALHDMKVGLEKFKEKTVIIDIGLSKD